MEPIKNITKSVLFFFVFFSFFSCTNKLSREKAEELIVKKLNFPQQSYVKFNKQYHKRPPNVYSIPTQISKEDEQMLNGFKNLGIITIRERNVPYTYGTRYPYAYIELTVTLTSEGEKYIIDRNEWAYSVKTCEITVGEITGIQNKEQSKTAEVLYTLKKINCTPFGDYYFSMEKPKSEWERMQNDRLNRKVFSLFDDGWRIN